MKRLLIALIAGCGLHGGAALAQQSLASTMEVYVFPKAGQDSSRQSQDEAACYEWAVGEVGTDPFEAQKQEQAAAEQAAAQTASAQQSTQGAGARGAVRGAAVGAVVGEIADDDAGKGAAWGAAIGGISSRRSARNQAHQASTQAQSQYQSTAQASASDIENFKKAFSVCLEAKEYMVKY